MSTTAIELSFQPHPWLAGPHAQTIAAFYLPGPKFAYRAQQHRVSLDDGDQLVLHDDVPQHWQAGDHTVLMLHGLSGCHGSPYMVRIAGKLNGLGVRVFRMDQRGCGAGTALAKLPYHSGRSGDAASALEFIARLCPSSPTTLIGFSMGGNVSLKLLGELRETRCGNLNAAIAICPAVELHTCSLQIEQPSNRVYQNRLLKSIVRQNDQRCRRVAQAQPIAPDRRPRTLRELDDSYVAPVCGFSSADDYYKQSSSARVIENICLPTQILAARDDPLVPFAQFDGLRLPSCVALHATDAGGHLGYLGRPGMDDDRRWMDWRVIEWVMQHRQASAASSRCEAQPSAAAKS